MESQDVIKRLDKIIELLERIEEQGERASRRENYE